MWELDPDCMERDTSGLPSGLDEAVSLLLRYYYRKRCQLNDETFLNHIKGEEIKEKKIAFVGQTENSPVLLAM